MGFSPWSRKESDMTKRQTLHFQGLFKPGEGKRSSVNFPSPPFILPHSMALTLSMLCQLSKHVNALSFYPLPKREWEPEIATDHNLTGASSKVGIES